MFHLLKTTWHFLFSKFSSCYLFFPLLTFFNNRRFLYPSLWTFLNLVFLAFFRLTKWGKKSFKIWDGGAKISACRLSASPYVCGASVCPQKSLTTEGITPFSHTSIHTFMHTHTNTHTLTNSPLWKPDPLHISSSNAERNGWEMQFGEEAWQLKQQRQQNLMNFVGKDEKKLAAWQI